MIHKKYLKYFKAVGLFGLVLALGFGASGLSMAEDLERMMDSLTKEMDRQGKQDVRQQNFKESKEAVQEITVIKKKIIDPLPPGSKSSLVSTGGPFTGTWAGILSGGSSPGCGAIQVTLTQTGSSVSGSWRDTDTASTCGQNGSGSISGTVSGNVANLTALNTCAPGVNAIGTATLSGTSLSVSMTEQPGPPPSCSSTFKTHTGTLTKIA
jgi:hypothetical protein